MNGLLSGKRIVITGAARGLGFHFAKACAEQGAAVVMCDILKGELAESAHALSERAMRSNRTLSIWPIHSPLSRCSAPLASRVRSMAR